MNCAVPVVSTPRSERRVVCGLLEVMLSFWPSSAFCSVDLPTLGRPIRATAPHRNGAGSIGSSALNLLERAHRGLLLGVAAAAPAARRPHGQLGNQAFDLEALAVRRAPGPEHRVLRQGDLPC